MIGIVPIPGNTSSIVISVNPGKTLDVGLSDVFAEVFCFSLASHMEFLGVVSCLPALLCELYFVHISFDLFGVLLIHLLFDDVFEFRLGLRRFLFFGQALLVRDDVLYDSFAMLLELGGGHLLFLKALLYLIRVCCLFSGYFMAFFRSCRVGGSFVFVSPHHRLLSRCTRTPITWLFTTFCFTLCLSGSGHLILFHFSLCILFPSLFIPFGIPLVLLEEFLLNSG